MPRERRIRVRCADPSGWARAALLGFVPGYVQSGCGGSELNLEEAERALAIVRTVVQNTRDDLIARNWGLVWIIHSFTNASAFVVIGLVIERQNLALPWYLVPLVTVAAVDLAITLLLTERDQGVKSFVELQIHGIW